MESSYVKLYDQNHIVSIILLMPTGEYVGHTAMWGRVGEVYVLAEHFDENGELRKDVAESLANSDELNCRRPYQLYALDCSDSPARDKMFFKTVEIREEPITPQSCHHPYYKTRLIDTLTGDIVGQVSECNDRDLDVFIYEKYGREGELRVDIKNKIDEIFSRLNNMATQRLVLIDENDGIKRVIEDHSLPLRTRSRKILINI